MPHLRRHQRLGLSIWLIVALLFTQLASAAYACPRLMTGTTLATQALTAVEPSTGSAEVADVAEAADDTTLSMMADMPDCDGMMMTMASPHGPAAMDPAQPQLCKLHCSPASQTVQASVVLDAPSAPLLLAVLDWAPAAQLLAGNAVLARRLTPSGAAPPGAPPRYLTLLVQRH